MPFSIEHFSPQNYFNSSSSSAGRPWRDEIICPACDGDGLMPAGNYIGDNSGITKPCYLCDGATTIIDPEFRKKS